MGTLTVAKAKSLSEPGLYRADPTLYLRIAPGGSKSWVQRLTIEGRRHDLGLGGFPLVTLAEARVLAYGNRRVARSGGDPLAAKRRAKPPRFREAAARTCDALRPRWRNRKHAKDWMATLERHAHPVIGDLNVDRIRREDVLRVLTPIWTRRPETARRVRQRMRAVLRWCWAHGYVSENVAGEGIEGALPKMPAVKQHFRALPNAHTGIGGIVRALPTPGESDMTTETRLLRRVEVERCPYRRFPLCSCSPSRYFQATVLGPCAKPAEQTAVQIAVSSDSGAQFHTWPPEWLASSIQHGG